METKTCLKDVTLTLKDNSLILERKSGFFSLDMSRSGPGIRNIRSIIISSRNFTEDSPAQSGGNGEKILEDILTSSKALKPASIALGNYDIKKCINKTYKQVTAIITPGMNLNQPMNINIIVDENLDNKSIIMLFQSIVEAKTSVFCDFGMISPDMNFKSTGNLYTNNDLRQIDEITVTCTGRGNVIPAHEMFKLRLMATQCIYEALNELLKNFRYPLDILDHIENVGVTLDDLIEAGMELVVGVNKTEELELKLKNQIIKSLEDLNVVALIMAGIRVEEDLSRHKIRGIDVDDDPAYLYSDEVLGMAVANQIAGTKAIFNFKRYDEEKPGILSILGPMLDDVFAGLVAGCMSKIFEE